MVLILLALIQVTKSLRSIADLDVQIGAYIDYYTEETIPFFTCYDFLICNTKRHLSAFEWHPHVFYIPWGTDLELFQPKSYKSVNSKQLTFFHSCGYSPRRKGTDFVLRAFSQMTKSALLVIHSQVDLLEVMPDFRKIIVQLQQRGKLQIINQTVTAPGLYHLGDVYVGPSRLEGIGLPLLESQACGLPLITCDYPPMNEFIAPTTGCGVSISRLWARKDGYYWPQCQPDIQKLATTLDQYVNQFPIISELKQSTRRYAEVAFNWSQRKTLINSIFENSVSIRRNSKEVLEAVLAFERQRQGFAYRLSSKYPLIWKLYRRYNH
jgi:glycosyltransferase involved in cell wall biosynthesis